MKKIYAAVVFVLFFNFLKAQITFQKAYGISGHNYANDVIQTFDGGYIVAGRMEFSGVGTNRVSLMKVNSMGDTVWSKIYGSPMENTGQFFSILQTSDSGYVVCGVVSDTIHPGAHIIIMKTNVNGNIVWEKNYLGINNVWGQTIQRTDDGGFIIGAYQANAILIILKADSLGTPLWSKTFGGIGLLTSGPVYIRQTTDGGYIISRSIKPNLGFYDVYIIKTDNIGNKIWAKTYGGIDDDYGICVQETFDGGYIILGTSRSFGAGNKDIYLIKTDGLGTVVWSKTYGGTANEDASNLFQTPDSGYLIKGTYNTNINCLIKTNANGDTVWTKGYSTFSWVSIYGGVKPTNDNGYIILSYTQQFGLFKFVLIKTDSVGFAAACNEIPANVIVTTSATITDTIGSATDTVITSYVPNIIEVPVSPIIYDLCNPTVINEITFLIISILPNPFTTSITISFQKENINPTSLTIKNILGQTVFMEKSEIRNPKFEMKIDLEFLPQGIYFVEVMTDEGRVVKKIVKQ